MLSYESKPILTLEPPGNFIASLVLGSLACAVGVFLWWQMIPGLWVLATFTPRGPIRPMGAVAALFLFMFGGVFSVFLLVMPAASLSKRRWAQIVATLGAISSALPALNLVAFFVIIVVRGIELGD